MKAVTLWSDELVFSAAAKWLEGEAGKPSIDIHVERDDKVAKFWFDPIRLQNNGGFSRFELSEIWRIIYNAQLKVAI